MKNNVAHSERTVRFGLGMLLLASPALEQPTYPFNLFGLVLVLSAVAAYCPLYGLLTALRAQVTSPHARSEA